MFTTVNIAETIIKEKGGDTDTNAAIYGARVGFERLMEEQEENWEILINSEHITKQKAKGRGGYCPTVIIELY